MKRSSLTRQFFACLGLAVCALHTGCGKDETTGAARAKAELELHGLRETNL
jgi:hypothetical protein